MITSYDAFIAAKTKRGSTVGFDMAPLTVPAFDWQGHVIRWAVKKGRAALFEDCGLGKTLQQLEWAHQVCLHTGLPVIIFTPLAVASQTAAEAAKFGISARVVDSEDEIQGAEVVITNYDKLPHFSTMDFGGVVLDESSILKSFTGKTRRALTARFADTRFRLCCTATPSPNDYTELGQHAEFLGICTPAQMLATWFINDTFNTGDWRLKKHAELAFWDWVASWAACLSKPSDIGFADDGYNLPQLNLRSEIVEVDETANSGDELFRHVTLSATTLHKELRFTAEARASRVAQEVNASEDPWIVWCNTNDESQLLVDMIHDAVEVKGSDDAKKKERNIDDFTNGNARVIITKPSIAGYGLNWQHCHNIAFVGLSYSFEDFYQALRRSYRFGQKHEVNALIVQAATEGPILQSIKRKMASHEEMQKRMKAASQSFLKANHQ